MVAFEVVAGVSLVEAARRSVAIARVRVGLLSDLERLVGGGRKRSAEEFGSDGEGVREVDA